MTGSASSQAGTPQVVPLSIGSGQSVDTELIARVDRACAEVEGSPGALLVLRLTGTAGDGAPPTGLSIHTVNKWERALRRLERLDAVTIAVADGLCAGPALEALLAADHRIGGPGLRLRLPAAAGEPWPGMAVHRVANQVGVARSRSLVLFGAEISAVEAVGLGLVDEIAADLDRAVSERVTAVGELTGSELAIRRRLLLEASAVSFEEALGTHLAACDRTLRRMQGVQPA
ncbi:enoyl-CoA-hydratase DpgB [Micromonospora wenchangensis]|uniref:enoyl-CoA-hydratase DpgB n=1 Tax=Micromonospora wenchangensis TaxID=1185415 RepID=UPI003D74F123